MCSRMLKVHGSLRRKRGRPRRKWLDCTNEDLAEKIFEEQDVNDRSKCRSHSRNSNLGKAAEEITYRKSKEKNDRLQ